MFKFNSIRFLILVLVLVLLISLCGSCSEGFMKSSTELNRQSSSINKALSDYKTKPMPPDSPPGTKEFIDKNLLSIETFAKRLNDLVIELSTTMDTTSVPTAKIDELIHKYTAPPGTKMTPDVGISIAIAFDLGGIKQLASEVPKSIFDKYINYRIELMNVLFSGNNIDEILNLASNNPAGVIDKLQMKTKISEYLVDFKQLKKRSWARSRRMRAARQRRLTDIPILPKSQTTGSTSWSFL
jgi:hypothetical protein